jgi:hypothetical protein
VEPNSRLVRLENDITEMKERLANLESEFQKAKEERSQMQMQLSGQDEKLDRILLWVDGAQKVAGIATRHWKTALKFGCGAVTAWGVTNPHVQSLLNFVAQFFGV